MKRHILCCMGRMRTLFVDLQESKSYFLPQLPHAQPACRPGKGKGRLQVLSH